MNNSKLLSFSLLTLFLLTTVVRADIAPPMININVTYDGLPVNGNFSASILTCANNSNASVYQVLIPNLSPSYDAAKGCYWVFAEPVREAACEEGWCSLYYFPSTDFKVAFYLPALNETFVTNEVNESNFSTEYRAQLYPNGSATIAALANPPNPPVDIYSLFVLALLFTLAIELAVAFLYLRAIKIKKKKRILTAVVLANIISIPILWFGFVYFLGALGFLLGEIFAVLFEGYFIYYFNKKMIKLKSAMIMSLVMNLASLIIGGIIVSIVALSQFM